MTDESQRTSKREDLEDAEDYWIAVARLADNLPSIPLDEVKKQLGLGRAVQNRKPVTEVLHAL